MLECCESLEKVKAEGMTFAKVACAGACAGASVRAIRANKSSLEEFRQHLLDSCLSENKHMIVSYDRKIFKQVRPLVPLPLPRLILQFLLFLDFGKSSSVRKGILG